MCQATLCVTDDGDFTYTKQVDTSGERANEIVRCIFPLFLGDCCTCSTELQNVTAHQSKCLLKHLYQPAIHARDKCQVFARRMPNHGQLCLLQETLIIGQNLINSHTTMFLFLTLPGSMSSRSCHRRCKGSRS